MEEYGTLHAEPIKIGKYKGHKYFVNMNQFLCLNGYAEIPEKWKEGPISATGSWLRTAGIGRILLSTPLKKYGKSVLVYKKENIVVA